MLPEKAVVWRRILYKDMSVKSRKKTQDCGWKTSITEQTGLGVNEAVRRQATATLFSTVARGARRLTTPTLTGVN